MGIAAVCQNLHRQPWQEQPLELRWYKTTTEGLVYSSSSSTLYAHPNNDIFAELAVCFQSVQIVLLNVFTK